MATENAVPVIPEELHKQVHAHKFPLHTSPYFEKHILARNILLTRDRQYFRWLCRNMIQLWTEIKYENHSGTHEEQQILIYVTWHWIPPLYKENMEFVKDLLTGFLDGSCHWDRTLYLNVDKGHSLFAQKRKFNMTRDKFHFMKKIDTGADEAVWQVIHKKSGDILACKEVPCPDDDETHLASITNEIDTMSQIRHRNIVQLHSSMQDKNTVYIVFDLYTGSSLRALLSLNNKKKRRMSEMYIKKITSQVCSALQYIHDREIIHGDLKPENIMFKEEGSHTIKIINFGLSLKTGSGARSSRRAGTPPYMAPEIWLGLSYTNTIDIWSFGIISFEMALGYLPFMQRSLDGLKNLVVSGLRERGTGKGPYIPKDVISDAFADFIATCLTTRVDHRPTADELHVNSWLSAESIPMTHYIAHALTMGKLTPFQEMMAQANVEMLTTEKKARLKQFCAAFGITNHCPLTGDKFAQLMKQYSFFSLKTLKELFSSSAKDNWTVEEITRRLAYQHVLTNSERRMTALGRNLIDPKDITENLQGIPIFMVTKSHFRGLAKNSNMDEEVIDQIEADVFGDEDKITSDTFDNLLTKLPEKIEWTDMSRSDI